MMIFIKILMNLSKKCKTLIIFDDIVANMLVHKILQPIPDNYLLEIES